MKSVVFLIPPPAEQVNRKTRKFHRRFPPLSELMSAALFRQNGWQVSLFDLYADDSLDIDSVIKTANQADVAILTTNPYADWQCPSLDLAPVQSFALKLAHPKLILTGNHGTHYPKALLENLRAKAVVRAEPEGTLLATAEGLLLGSDLSKIPNLSFLGPQGVHHNPKGALPPMDELPSPAYELVNLANYHYEILGDRFALLEAARGCPFSCNFCNRSMFENKYRKKSLAKFLAEVDDLVINHRCESLYVFDLEFTINKPLVKGFCEHLIQKNYKLRWACQTRADSVDAEMLALMKKSGCRLIHFGVESGDEEILKQTNKRIKRDDIREGVRLTQAAGINSAGFFILGHPGETRAHFEKTLQFATELDLTYASFHPLLPFPGSPLFEQRFGAGPYWDAPIPKDLSYFTPSEEAVVLAFVQKAYWKYFLRPKTLWRAVAHGDPKLYLRQFRLFLNFLKPSWPQFGSPGEKAA